jgi:predicted phage terminase large subunit-like protein
MTSGMEMKTYAMELQLCRESFRFFLGYCYMNIYKRRFDFHEFHDNLIEALLAMKPGARIILNAPPRIGKTEIVKHYIAWRILNNPGGTVIYVSYDQKLVNRKNAEIMDVLKWLSGRFGIDELKMKPNSNGKTEWVNKANGAIIARGSNNALTGGGCNMLMVIDDPNKPADRTSPATLEQRNKVFVNTVRNRIDTPDVPIIIIQQRIASMDLTGFLLNGGTNDRWEHCNYPAIKDDGAALCPERLPISEIETYKSDPFTYNAQYLQIPLDDVGKLFDRNKLVLSSERPSINSMRVVISVDASCKGDIGNDFNAISVIGHDDVNYYVMEVLNFRADITVLIERCRELRLRWREVPILFEMKANGSAACQILRKEMSGILECNPYKDKIERALAVKYLFDAGNINFTLRGMVWGEVVNQFTTFPHCKHDDIVDCVVQGIAWLQKLPRNPVPKSAPALNSRPQFGSILNPPAMQRQPVLKRPFGRVNRWQ